MYVDCRLPDYVQQVIFAGQINRKRLVRPDILIEYQRTIQNCKNPYDYRQYHC